jgi:hypothetical protein
LETFVQGHIDGLLVAASWVERLRGELGLGGVHQVWGEVPSWYLWLGDSPGAYCLEMVDVSQVGGGLINSNFAVKFYPALDSEFFQALPPGEKQSRQSALFDESGAPAFETRHDIPADFFTVGVLALTMDPDQEWGLYTITALSVCRQVGRLGNGEGEEVLLGTLPGWQLSFTLYHRLLCLHAFHKKHPPVNVQFSVEPGFEKIYTSGVDVLTRRCSTNKTLSLSVLFAPDPANPPAQPLALMRQELEESGGRKIVDQSFTCQHFPDWDMAPAGQPLLSEDWWRLAGVDYKSELASACGCF